MRKLNPPSLINLFTHTLAAGALTHVAAQGNEPDREMRLPFRPNILVITCEDISPRLSCYGDSTVHTPVIDRLAREGVVFSQCHDISGVCAPSRFALITGMYPSSCGAGNMRTSQKNLPDGIPPYEAVPPPEVKCVSEYFRRAGYYCTNNEKTDYQFRVPLSAWDECSNTAHWDHRPAGMPFFSIFNIMSTHESMIWTFPLNLQRSPSLPIILMIRW
jgi:hypothetical protein